MLRRRTLRGTLEQNGQLGNVHVVASPFSRTQETGALTHSLPSLQFPSPNPASTYLLMHNGPPSVSYIYMQPMPADFLQVQLS